MAKKKSVMLEIFKKVTLALGVLAIVLLILAIIKNVGLI